MVSLEINLCRTNLEKRKPPVKKPAVQKKPEELPKRVQKKQEQKLPERKAPPRRRGVRVPQKKWVSPPKKKEKKVEKPKSQSEAPAAKRKPESQEAAPRPKKRKRLWPVYDRYRYGPLPNLLIAVSKGRGGRDRRPSNNRPSNNRGRGNPGAGARHKALPPRPSSHYKETPKSPPPTKQSLFPNNEPESNPRDDAFSLPPRNPTRGAPPRRQAFPKRNQEQKRQTSIMTKSYRKEQHQQQTAREPQPLFSQSEAMLPPRHGHKQQSSIQTRGYQAEKNYQSRGYQPEKKQNRGYQQDRGYQSTGRVTNATPLFPQNDQGSAAPTKKPLFEPEPLFQEQKSQESNSFRPRAPPNRNRGRGNGRRNRGYNEGGGRSGGQGAGNFGRKNRGRLGGFNEDAYKTRGRSREGYITQGYNKRNDDDRNGSYGDKGRGSFNKRGGRGRGSGGRKPYQRFAGWDGSTRFSMF